jgi:hypothetical protein
VGVDPSAMVLMWGDVNGEKWYQETDWVERSVRVDRWGGKAGERAFVPEKTPGKGRGGEIAVESQGGLSWQAVTEEFVVDRRQAFKNHVVSKSTALGRHRPGSSQVVVRQLSGSTRPWRCLCLPSISKQCSVCLCLGFNTWKPVSSDGLSLNVQDRQCWFIQSWMPRCRKSNPTPYSMQQCIPLQWQQMAAQQSSPSPIAPRS